MTTITFLQTGGTIDKAYPSRPNAYGFIIGESAAVKILQRMHLGIEYSVQTVCKKDSTELDDKDREAIARACRQSPVPHIVITHGTDTMLQTARFLARHAMDKVLVLTGSFLPATFKDSDAEFNLGFAVAAVQCLRPGVYIAMNGRVYNWNACQKGQNSFVDKTDI